MMEVHFPQRTLERFLRAELTRRENAEIVKHLLMQCRICQETLRAAADRQGFPVAAREGAAGAELPLAARLG